MTVWCLLLDHDNKPIWKPFDVPCQGDNTISALKRKVKEETPNTLKNVDASGLTVWRCKYPAINLHQDARILEKQILDLFDDEKVVEINERTKIRDLHLDSEEKLFVKSPYPTEAYIATASGGHIPMKRTRVGDVGADHQDPGKQPFLALREQILASSKGPNNADLMGARILHDFLWENGETALKAILYVKSIDVPSLGGQSSETEAHDANFYDLGRIPGYIQTTFLKTQFYLRKEYHEMDSFMEENAKQKDRGRGRKGHVLLLGHPGIGKSVYLTHSLIRRLSDGKPTCYFHGSRKRFLFAHDGVHLLSTSEPHMELMLDNAQKAVAKDTLTLFNCNADHEKIGESDSYWKTLVASPLRLSRYADWAKELEAKRYIMCPWSWEEVCAGISLVTPSHGQNPLNNEAWQDMYAKYGGSARHLFGPTHHDELDTSIKTAIDNVNLSQLTNPGDIESGFNHHLVMVEPLVRDGSVIRNLFTTRFVSTHVARLVWAKKASMNRREAFALFADAFEYQLTRGIAGCAFESVGHDYIRNAMHNEVCVYGLTNTGYGSTHSLNLPLVQKHALFRGSTLPPLNEMKKDTYHQFTSKRFPAINSFLLDVNNGIIAEIILFQFTINETHSIEMGKLKDWWRANPDSHKWRWRLIFVVPIKPSSGLVTVQPPPTYFQPKAQAITGEISGMRFSQYVWPVGMPALKDFLDSHP